MAKQYKPIDSTIIVNPYIVQLLLSKDFIIQKHGREAFAKKYLDVCQEVSKQVNKKDDNFIILTTVSDDVGLVDYRQITVSFFDFIPSRDSTITIGMDTDGNVRVSVDDEENEEEDEEN